MSLDRWGGFLSGFLKGRSRVPRRSPEMSPPGAGMAGREAELLLVFAWLLIWTVRLVFLIRLRFSPFIGREECGEEARKYGGCTSPTR